MRKKRPKAHVNRYVKRIQKGYAGFTQEFKKQIRERDGYRCQVILPNGSKCLRPSAIVHHNMRVSSGGRTSSLSCMVVCERCHGNRPGHKHV